MESTGPWEPRGWARQGAGVRDTGLPHLPALGCRVRCTAAVRDPGLPRLPALVPPSLGPLVRGGDCLSCSCSWAEQRPLAAGRWPGPPGGRLPRAPASWSLAVSMQSLPPWRPSGHVAGGRSQTCSRGCHVGAWPAARWPCSLSLPPWAVAHPGCFPPGSGGRREGGGPGALPAPRHPGPCRSGARGPGSPVLICVLSWPFPAPRRGGQMPREGRQGLLPQHPRL